MKTNEEFLDGIYDKHSALLKKRKKNYLLRLQQTSTYHSSA